MRIPGDLLVPIVNDYLEHYETSAIAREWGRHECNILSPRTILADEAHIKPDTLYRILTGRVKTVDLGMADNLLVAMGLSHLWHEEPLAHLYEHGDPRLARNGNRVNYDTALMCMRGHPRSEENNPITTAGKIRCRACEALKREAQKARGQGQVAA